MADPLNGVYKARQLSLRRSKAGVARLRQADSAPARSERTTRVEPPWRLTRTSGGNRLGSRAASGAWRALMLAAIGRGSARCAL
jgi:hypothetical protein